MGFGTKPYPQQSSTQALSTVSVVPDPLPHTRNDPWGMRTDDEPIRGEVRASGFRRVSHGLFLAERPGLGAEEERQTSLDELAALIDWPQADHVMALLYPSAKGEKAWPPLAMFKAVR